MSDAAVFLDLRGLAAYSSLGVSTLRGYMKARRRPLPHYRMRGKVMVKRDEFDRWMLQWRVEAGAAPGEIDRLLEGLR